MTKIRTALAHAFLIITALAGFSGCSHTRGLTRIEDVAPSRFDVSKLKLRSFLKDGESSISGKVLRQRAVELKCNLGLSDGKRLLAEQGKIPADFRDSDIPLPGTLVRDALGTLGISYLHFEGGRWMLRFIWMDEYWYGRDHLACSE